MLSLVTIVSIFAEIFASGILVFGSFVFLAKFLKDRKIKDIHLSTIFLLFFTFTALTVLSQILYNLNHPLSELILIHRIIAACIIIASLFVLSYALIYRKRKFLSFLIPFGLYCLFAIFMIFNSPLNLVYREGIIEPVLNFRMALPLKSFWSLGWIFLAVSSYFSRLKTRPARILKAYTGFSSLLFVVANVLTFQYTTTGTANYLLFSWIVTFFGVMGLSLGEGISPESPFARNPLKLFPSRILIKLIFIFALLIVILFEITTLAILTISRTALSNSVMNSYHGISNEVKNKIVLLPQWDKTNLQNIVAEKRIGKSGVAYIVDLKGEVLAHPDRAMIGVNLSNILPVKNVIEGQSGGGEYKDTLGYRMVGSYVPIPGFGGVIVEEQVEDAYFELRRLETTSLVFIIIGILVTVTLGIVFARGIERPIRRLIAGTDAVAAGDLSYHIEVKTTDEIGTLAQAFNRMTRNLKDTQERLILSEKLVSLGTMAAGMAHEIKNPLVALRTFSQLFQQKWDDPIFREKFANTVPANIERINKIAESLLKFGRPERPEVGRADVNGVLEEVLLLNESECKKHNIRMTTKFAEVPEITGDAGQLSQAFLNLILNGIQAMEKGGELIVKTDVGEVVKLGAIGKGVETEEGEVVWGEEKEEEKEEAKPIPVVFIEITDTGSGIPPDSLKSLFDPFFTTKMKGTGMGLPITLRIIEDHKGSIKVKSRTGKGTTFLITLPQRMEDL
jgi:signal transduction histidine kinase